MARSSLIVSSGSPWRVASSLRSTSKARLPHESLAPSAHGPLPPGKIPTHIPKHMQARIFSASGSVADEATGHGGWSERVMGQTGFFDV